MEQCRPDLTLSSEYVRDHTVYIACEAPKENLLGFYALAYQGSWALLDYLYVDPRHLRQNVGRQLWQHAVQSARTHGTTHLVIDADPHAEPFYLRMGARRIGLSPSGSIPGRLLPQMGFTLLEEES